MVRDLLLTGRSFNATKAQQIGLVSQVVAEGEALRAARATAAQIGKFDRRTAVAAKKFIKPIPHEELRQEIEIFCELFARTGRGSRTAQVRGEHRCCNHTCPERAARGFHRKTGSCQQQRKPWTKSWILAATHFKVPRDKLAPDEDFFKTLGIDSLQALDLLTRLENHFHVELPDYELQGVTDFRTLAGRIHSRL